MTAPKPKVGRPPRAKKASDDRITIRVSKAELARWGKLAGYVPISVWARQQLNELADKELGPEKKG